VPSRRLRAPIAVVLALAGWSSSMVWTAAPAAAQDLPAVRLKLVAQPVWAKPGDRLDLKLRLYNDGPDALEGFGLGIAAYGRLGNRSALHETFDSIPGTAALSSYTKTYPDGRVAPGGARDVLVRDPIDTLVSLAGETESGVYPLTISLFDSSGATLLDFVTTDLLFYPSKPEVPLDLVLVLPINDVPAEAPDGVFRPDSDGVFSLKEAVTGDGWLAGTVDALDRWTGGTRLRLGLAPTPRLMEEVQHLAEGYERSDGDDERSVDADGQVPKAAAGVLDRLGGVMSRHGVQPLLAPYAFPDLPSVAAASDQLLTQDQVRVGQTTIKEALGVDLGPKWVFAPAGRLDPASLRQLLAGSYGQRTFFSPGSIEEPADPTQAGCPDPALTFACPVSVELPAGQHAVGYVADQGVQDRFAALAQGGSSRLNLQELFAETAMIHAELPGTTGRVVHATIPSLWHPPSRLLNRMLRGFATAPWLKTLTPAGGLAAVDQRSPRRLRQSLPPLQNDPGRALLDAVREAGTTVQSFGTIGPPDALVRRLSRDVLTAQSRTWWIDPTLTATGLRYATSARDTAMSELAKISIGGVERVTMTSRQAEIPLAIFNDTGYPVKIRIQFNSSNFDFDPDEVEATFQPGGDRLPEAVSATAQSSGIFRIEVVAQTPDGLLTFGSKAIEVRSTEFNRIALGLTLGALAFLIFFYVLKAIRRRRDGGPGPSVEAAELGGT
jgi:Family of unknown function (DUF6049)